MVGVYLGYAEVESTPRLLYQLDVNIFLNKNLPYRKKL